LAFHQSATNQKEVDEEKPDRNAFGSTAYFYHKPHHIFARCTPLKITETNLRQGFVKVVPDSQDDLWHLYNVIYKGDEVYAYTSRAIKSDTEASRPKSAERVSAFMGVRVESVAWDKFLGKLRVHGIIIHAPDIIPTGAHHTIAVSLNHPITIVKKSWEKHALDRLKRASETEKPMLIVAIDDEGYAIAETRQYGVEVKIEERIKLPGKHEAEKRQGATNEYYKRVLNSLSQLWSQNHNSIVIVGVGFVKNDFVTYLKDNAGDMAKSLADVKSVNNGGVAGIYEALRSGVLLKAAHAMRVLEETEVMEEAMKRLGKGDNTITYGLADVESAAQVGAIEKLILADTLLRESEDEPRLQLEKIMREVEHRAGSVTVVSTEHEAGAKLLALGGIAALLRFPLYRG
jgi:protein pelota